MRYGNLFRVPPYFFYIARAFAVLEGIGLTNDPDYSVVSECLPYVSQRLLTDRDPRIAGALQSFIYGADKDGARLGSVLAISAEFGISTSTPPRSSGDPTPCRTEHFVAAPV